MKKKSFVKKKNNYEIILPSIIIYFMMGFIVFGWKFDYNIKEVKFILLILSFVLIGFVITLSQLIEVYLNEEGLEIKKKLTKRILKFKTSDISFKIISGSVYLSFSKIEVLVLNKNKKIATFNFKNMKELKEFYDTTRQNKYKWYAIPTGKRWEVLKK
ncbi:MAG: hypothetical protein ACWA41_04660 [Putridiphycobacter sp.]